MPEVRPPIEILRHIYLFEDLDDAQLSQVHAQSRIVHLAAHEQLFAFGQPAERFYYVVAGHMKLFRVSEAGSEKVIEVLHPGETFAEALMFMDHKVYPVEAEAIEACELYSFDMAGFTAILRNSVDTCFRLMGTMSRRLRKRIEEINCLTLQDATRRLVTYLLEQLPSGVVQSPEIHLETPKGVIASHLSIKPETFSRILSRLVAGGLITVRGNHIVMHDVAGLRRLLQAPGPAR